MVPEPYRVSATNTAKASENKIHDDATARRFGFSGGLVGGVHVYAYMAHQPVAYWGRVWLERGTGECRFSKPVYEGDIAEIIAEETAGGLSLQVMSRGELCATGSAALPVSVVAPAVAEFQATTPPGHDARPAADEQSLAVGRWLGMNPLLVTAEFHAHRPDLWTDQALARSGARPVAAPRARPRSPAQSCGCSYPGCG